MARKAAGKSQDLSSIKVGVLALQGSFLEHLAMLRRIGVEVEEVRLPDQLDDLDGLIIPGGESTTIGKLAVDFGLLEPLKKFGKEKPIWGTCAGAILLSRDAHRDQPLLELMDITVDRNAFGRQIASFEMDLDIPALENVAPVRAPFPGVFIRAPLITSVGGQGTVLAELPDERIVAAQQGHLMATAFHPELTEDDRIHRYFIDLIQNNNQK
jgi:5'-phosphate synthase pdxT subunit